MRPKQPKSRPTPTIHSETRRAYWRVVILRQGSDGRRTRTRRVVCWRPLDNHRPPGGSVRSIKSGGGPVFLCRTVVRSAVYPLAATSSTLAATTSQPRSLLSIARLNMARCRARPSIWSFRSDRPDVFGAQRRRLRTATRSNRSNRPSPQTL
jgi:hypothetical protein